MTSLSRPTLTPLFLRFFLTWVPFVWAWNERRRETAAWARLNRLGVSRFQLAVTYELSINTLHSRNGSLSLSPTKPHHHFPQIQHPFHMLPKKNSSETTFSPPNTSWKYAPVYMHLDRYTSKLPSKSFKSFQRTKSAIWFTPLTRTNHKVIEL